VCTLMHTFDVRCSHLCLLFFFLRLHIPVHFLFHNRIFNLQQPRPV
jgi:hypothetical protein